MCLYNCVVSTAQALQATPQAVAASLPDIVCFLVILLSARHWPGRHQLPPKRMAGEVLDSAGVGCTSSWELWNPFARPRGAARHDNHPSRCAAEGGRKSLALAQAVSASLSIISVCTTKTRLEVKSTSARENHKENGAETASQAQEYQDGNESRQHRGNDSRGQLR